jgi:hypothetical protein
VSEAIRRMLAERARAAEAHEGARRRAVIEPHRRAYAAGHAAVRRWMDGDRRGQTLDALIEGVVDGLMNGDWDAGFTWNHSLTRRALLERLDAETGPSGPSGAKRNPHPETRDGV